MPSLQLPWASPQNPDPVPSSGERSADTLHHRKSLPSIRVRAPFHQGHALFFVPFPQASRALRERSGLCHRPPPPGTLPPHPLPCPSGPPDRLPALRLLWGNSSIPRVPPFLSRFQSPRAPAAAPALRSAARPSLSLHPRPPAWGALPPLWASPVRERSHPPFRPPHPGPRGARGPPGALPRACPARLCAAGARAASRLPRPHAHTHRAQLTPGSGRKGGGEREEGAQSRGAPAPAPRGAASAIAASRSRRRGGSERGRSPDLPEPGVG